MQQLKPWQRLLLLLLVTLSLAIAPAASWAAGADGVVDVYFFHSESCPHCREQMLLMQDIDTYNEDVDVHIIEIEVSQETGKYRQYLQENNIQTAVVPRTAIGDFSFSGYGPTSGPREYIEAYSGYVGHRNQIVMAISEAVGRDIYSGAHLS